jgi:hypothetical protein
MMPVIYGLSLTIDGAVWRAAFVAALAISVFMLARYWRSLDGRARRERLPLVMLRGAALLLISCALAGVRLKYETATGARVPVRFARGAGVDASGKRRDEESVTQRIVGVLKEKGLEAFEDTQGNGPEAVGLEDEKVDAAVLVTDGAMSADEAQLEVDKTKAVYGGVPVYVVTDIESVAGPVVALEGARPMGHAERGVPVAVRCDVHASGMRGRESLITISDDAKVQASARVSWTSDDERRSVTLEVVPKTAGWMNYTARVESSGGLEDAAMLSRSFAVEVEERRVRVLFFEGEPTWEAKFIRRALEQAGIFEVNYFGQVSRAAAVGAVDANEEQGASANQSVEGREEKDKAATPAPETQLHQILTSAARLNLYDCIIVGATPNEMLSAAESARLREWVERRGGGLVVLGGNSFSGSIASPNGRLSSLLPAQIDPRGFASEAQQLARGAPVEAEKAQGAVALNVTEAGAGGALSGYLNASEAAPTKLAAMLTGQGLRLGALRPGASVLGVAGQGAAASGTSEAGAPLVAAMRYGAGRSLLFAPADSWRIRTSASGEQDEAGGPFGALWQGIVLWASGGARPSVEIVLNDESPEAVRPVTAEIRVRDASFAPLKIERLSARLQPLTEAQTEEAAQLAAQPQEVAFVPDEADASLWRARFITPAPGRYALEVDYVAGGKRGSLEKRFAVVALSRLAAGAARDTLERGARETGGEIFSVSNVNQLAARLDAAKRGSARATRTWEIRTWWPLAVIIPLLLSAEWFLRRWWRID